MKQTFLPAMMNPNGNESPGETIQERFRQLWEKAKLGLTSPEENEWMLKVQKDYWENPQSLGNLYR